MRRLFWILGSLLLISSGFGCGDKEDEGMVDDFDRQEMLIHWADQMIVPTLTAFADNTASLKVAGATFANDPTLDHLTTLRNAWYEAYLLWQRASMFEIGKAEELRYRDQLNIYPTDVAGIEDNISTGSYNLELPSQNDRQGFPALDYLLYGLAADDTALLDVYLANPAYAIYLNDLVQRIDALTATVLAAWNGSYRDEFVNNSGSAANTSVNKLVNDYLFYYEKALRAGKIGIPAGVFSGSPLPEKVEAFYKNDISKALFDAALNASQDFFNGKSFGSITSGVSLKAYLDYLNTAKAGADLSGLINAQFDAARAEAADLLPSFTEQIAADNARMLSVFDQLQLNVVLLKVDMLQALNISIDYVDADGD